MRFHGAVRLLILGLLLLIIPAALSSPSTAQIGIGISVRIGPPALPVYEQPLCPGPGYLWTPGYWAWSDDDGYYWVPGTWVEAPEPGLLWTPGYWGWNDGLYVWNAGYWGPQVGFYGGINYGFGYGGVGFFGGEWRGGSFFYNTAVMHVDTVHITNVYVNRTVIVNNDSHVAFNGGQGGVAARPTAQQESYARERHTPPVAAQVQQEHAASQNRALFARENNGRPAVAATARPGEFSGRGVVVAKAAGAPYHAPAMSPKEASAARSPNGPAENRPAENRKPSPSGAKAANRPAAPPNRNNMPNNRAKNNARPENARPANESHPEASHPENAPRTENARPQTARPETARPENARPENNTRSQNAAPKAESHPQAAPKAAPAAPKAKPAKPAPKPAPPKEEEKHDK
jgi:hypothetical protein